MNTKDNFKIQPLTLENVLNKIRQYPDKRQLDYTAMFTKDNNKPMDTSTLCTFFKSNNISQCNNLLFTKKTKKNKTISTARSLYFYNDDLKLQFKFIEFGNFIEMTFAQIHKIMIFDYRKTIDGDINNLFSLTITTNSNDILTFFKSLDYFNNYFNFNIFSNVTGYCSFTLNFKDKNSSIRFKKLLTLLKDGKHSEFTIYEIMNLCKIELKS